MSVETSTVQDSVLSCLTYASGTDIGKRREENQDSFGVLHSDDFHFYVVADGMGGVKGGAVASKLAIEIFSQQLDAFSSELTPEFIAESLSEANREIFDRGNSEAALAGMGTTFVGIGFLQQKMFIVNIGDSRAYRVRNGSIQQLTQDHTLIHELIMSGAISADQAENHPVAHMLTRSLGPTPAVEADSWIADDGPASGDRYLLCSDGLYNLVSDEEICAILMELPLDEAVTKCIDLANERGGTDNITVITVEVGASYPIGPESFPESEEVCDNGHHASPVSDEIVVDDEGALTPGINGHSGESDEQVGGDGGDKASPLISGSVPLEDLEVDELEEDGEADLEIEPQVELSHAEPEPSNSLFSLLLMFMLIGGSILGGTYYWKFGNKGSQKVQSAELIQVPKVVSSVDSKEVLPPKPDFAKTLPVQASPAQPVALSPSGSKPPIQTETSPSTFVEEVIGFSTPSSTVPSDLDLRRELLREQAAQLRRHIASFDQPLSGSVGSILTESNNRIKDLADTLSQLRADVDVATRKLAIWYGRRKRLESTEPINLAAEVSVSSETVRKSKESFERATWEYLKAAETLRYDPSDSAQKQIVAQLTRQRKMQQKQLVLDVRAAIDQEIGASEKRITELSLERDRLDREMGRARQQLDYAKILMHGDSRQKETKKQELESELAIVEAELAELSELVGTVN